MTNPRIFQVEYNEISLDLRECNKNRKSLDRNSDDDFLELGSPNINYAVNSSDRLDKCDKTTNAFAGRHSEETIKKIRKKIPGPAGTLPKLKEGQNINESLIQHISTEAKIRSHKDGINSSQLSQVNADHSSQNRAWNCAISDINSSCPVLLNVLNRFSLASVPKRFKMKTLPSCKVPVICASVASITLQNMDASVVLKDPSGTMLGSLHREIVKEYGDSIYVGTVFVLKQVGVFSPALGRNCYLNITPNNLVRIYTCKVSGSQENSDSVVRVQDPNFSELSALSEKVMKLSDSLPSSSSFHDSLNPVGIKLKPLHQSGLSNYSTSVRQSFPPTCNQNKINLMSPVGAKREPEHESGEKLNISPELLDDWIDDEEFVLALSQQENENHELQSVKPVSSKADDVHQDVKMTSQRPSHSKPSNTFAIESKDDFKLSFELFSNRNKVPIEMKNGTDRDSSQTCSSSKRIQSREDSLEASKKTKFSTPKKLAPSPAESGLKNSFSSCTKNPSISSNLPSQPGSVSQNAKSNFKFRPVSQSNMNSQSLYSQDLKPGSQLNNVPFKTFGQELPKHIPSISNHTSDGGSLEKLLEGLTDEMLDDF